jgi:hypothetical protein
VSASRTLSDLLQIFAGFERRALELYRHFAQVFAGHPTAARIWRAMSDAEAGHFAVLRLAEDRLPDSGGAAETDRRFDEDRLQEWESTVQELEAKGRRPGINPAEAAEITLEWERGELPRLLALLADLPEPARQRTAAGLVEGAQEHVDCLKELLRTVGSDRLLPEVSEIEGSLSRLKRLALGES